MTTCRCTGWWVQSGLGRQVMENLELRIDQGQIAGSGTDIVSDFEFAGSLRPDGKVELLKQYRRKHSVLYVGTYDGEGAFFGTWAIDGYRGEWYIRMTPAERTGQAIEDLK